MVRMSEGHLWCVHTIRFSELTKNLQFGAKTFTVSFSFIFLSHEFQTVHKIQPANIKYLPNLQLFKENGL